MTGPGDAEDAGWDHDTARRALTRELGAEEACRVDQPNTNVAVASDPTNYQALHGLLLGAWRGQLTEPPAFVTDADTGAWGGYGWVLLVGTRALAGWRSDLRMHEAEGRWGIRASRTMVMAVRDPFGIDNKRERVAWRVYVERFFADAGARGQCTTLLPVLCCRCGRNVWAVDRDGVGWCKKHHTEITRNEGKKGQGMAQGRMAL